MRFDRMCVDMKCDLCNKVFETLGDILIHKREHKFKCELCDTYFNNETDLKQHVYDHIQFLRHCEECNITILNKEYYIFHMQCHSNKPIKFKCEKCNKSFAFRQSFFTHRAQCGMSLACNLCSVKGFKRRADLLVHIRKHTSEHRYKCGSCYRSFARKGYLLIHLRSHGFQVKGKICPKCPKMFYRADNLKKHIKKCKFS